MGQTHFFEEKYNVGRTETNIQTVQTSMALKLSMKQIRTQTTIIIHTKVRHADTQILLWRSTVKHYRLHNKDNHALPLPRRIINYQELWCKNLLELLVK